MMHAPQPKACGKETFNGFEEVVLNMRWSVPRFRPHDPAVLGVTVGTRASAPANEPLTVTVTTLASTDVGVQPRAIQTDRLNVGPAQADSSPFDAPGPGRGFRCEAQLSQALGARLREAGKTSPLNLKGLGFAVGCACVSRHTVTLPAALSPEDMAFQLQAEVQALRGDDVNTALCLHRSIVDTTPDEGTRAHYDVHAMPRSCVQSLQAVAKAARLSLLAITPAEQAVQQAGATDAAEIDAVNLAAVAAHGAAWLAWKAQTQTQAHATTSANASEPVFSSETEGVNFLSPQDRAQSKAQQRWSMQMMGAFLAGAALTGVLAAGLEKLAAQSSVSVVDQAALAKADKEARKAHQDALTAQQARQAQQRWLQARESVQAQSAKWSAVLSQAAQGVWVASVSQQGARWAVQGEALNAPHAQQLLAQLKALDIWRVAPSLAQLQAMPASAGAAVWQFRIEAQLKEAP